MKNVLIIALFVLLNIGCSKKGNMPTESNEVLDSLGNVFYRDHDNSFLFIKHSGDSTKCYDIQSVDYRVMQLAPMGEWDNYVIKQTTITKSCDGQEGQKRSIRAELRPVNHPERILFALQHDADELYLEHDYYHTVFNGCCDAEPIHKIYDYEGNLLIEGNAKILVGAIPNNPLKFYLGYTPSKADSTYLGSIHMVYSDEEKYEVRILSYPLPLDLCSQYSPTFTLESANAWDTLEVYSNEYQLWNLESIQSSDQINNLAIRVEYYCEPYHPVEPILIPIRRGKPFGKDSTLTHIKLVHTMDEASSEP